MRRSSSWLQPHTSTTKLRSICVPSLAMNYFRMELHSPSPLAGHLVSSNRYSLSVEAIILKLSGMFCNRVSMAHPYLGILPYPFEKDILRIERTEMGVRTLAGSCRLHPSTVAVGDKLRTVADTQNGYFPNPAQIYLPWMHLIINRRATRRITPLHSHLRMEICCKVQSRNRHSIPRQPAVDELRGLQNQKSE